MAKLEKHPIHIFWITVLLASPAMLSGWLGDDYIHYALLHPGLEIPKPNDWSLFGLFSWVDGNPERAAWLKDVGALPWWTVDGFRFQFWRPLAELSHWLDHQLWHNYPWPMHIHSLAWYLATGFVLVRLYRKMAMASLAVVTGLAVFLWDSSHGATLSWIANRNALMAAFFGILSIQQFVLWRNTARLRSLLISLLSLFASLMSGEIGISTCGYLGAYAIAVDKGGVRKGMLALWPFVLLSLAWWSIYKLGHFGASHFDVNYIDPAESPRVFIQTMLVRLPVILFSQFGFIPADFSVITTFPITLFAAVASVFILLLLIVIWPLIRSSAMARFWALGTLFSALPVCSTLPADRNLIMVGIGGSALLGMLFHSLFENRFVSHRIRIGGTILLLIHLVISPLLLPIFSYSPKLWNQLMALSQTHKIPAEPGDRLLLFGVNLPVAFSTVPMRLAHGLSVPDKLWLLSSEKYRFRVLRLAPNSIEVWASDGLISEFEQGVRRLDIHPLPVGSEINTPSLRLKVRELDQAGHPVRLSIEFDADTAENMYVLYRKNQQFIKAALPNVGETLEIDLKPPK